MRTRLWLSAYVRTEEYRTASCAFDQTHRLVATGFVDVAHDYSGPRPCETRCNRATAPGATRSSDDYYARVVRWRRHKPCSILFGNPANDAVHLPGGRGER